MKEGDCRISRERAIDYLRKAQAAERPTECYELIDMAIEEIQVDWKSRGSGMSWETYWTLMDAYTKLLGAYTEIFGAYADLTRSKGVLSGDF